MVRRHLTAVLPAISRFALVLTRSRTDADDLVQMTCERALSRSAQWQAETKLESWLFRIMHSIWINELRSRQVRDRHRVAADTNVLTNGSLVDGERLSDVKMELRQVEDEVLRLPDSERLVLLMVCVQGLSYRETADVLGIPIGTVMSRLARARLDLSERMEAKNRGIEAANIRRFHR